MVFKLFQETQPNTFQINVIRDMGKVDVAHKAAGLSDRLLQKKVGFGWSPETMDVNFDAFCEVLNVKDRSPEKFYCDKCEGIGREWFSCSKLDPDIHQHDGEGTNSNRPRRQRNCVSDLDTRIPIMDRVRYFRPKGPESAPWMLLAFCHRRNAVTLGIFS